MKRFKRNIGLGFILMLIGAGMLTGTTISELVGGALILISLSIMWINNERLIKHYNKKAQKVQEHQSGKLLNIQDYYNTSMEDVNT